MSNLRKIARYIRHYPIIENANFIWDIARKPYNKLLNLNRRGVLINVANHQLVKLPPEFCSNDWENYETKSIKKFADFLKKNPDLLILDIGCSIGIYCVVALYASHNCIVIAFDPDLESLKSTLRMCNYAYNSNKRLKVVFGFLSENQTSDNNIISADIETRKMLNSTYITGDPGKNKYICIFGNDDKKIPFYSLDNLLIYYYKVKNKKVLIKCDVEGAELLVLKGAKNFINKYFPYLLLSVHPDEFNNYGYSIEQLKSFLTFHGYKINLISTDHGEHWWCEPVIKNND